MFLADFDGAPIRYALAATAVVALAVSGVGGDGESSDGASPVTSGH